MAEGTGPDLDDAEKQLGTEIRRGRGRDGRATRSTTCHRHETVGNVGLRDVKCVLPVGSGNLTRRGERRAAGVGRAGNSAAGGNDHLMFLPVTNGESGGR